MTRFWNLAIVCALITSLCPVVSHAQDELYLEITQPGLRRVAVATPPLMVLPGTPAEAALGFQETLDNDLGAAAPVAVVDPRLYTLVEDDPRPEILNQRWRAIGAQFLLSGTVVRAGGQLVVEARLVDLVSGEFAFAKRYRAGITDLSAGFCVKRGGFRHDFNLLPLSGLGNLMAISHQNQYF